MVKQPSDYDTVKADTLPLPKNDRVPSSAEREHGHGYPWTVVVLKVARQWYTESFLELSTRREPLRRRVP